MLSPSTCTLFESELNESVPLYYRIIYRFAQFVDFLTLLILLQNPILT